MKKAGIIAAAAGGLLLAAAIIAGIFFYNKANDNANAMYNDTLLEYNSLLINSGCSLISITENGKEIGLYSFGDLNMIDDINASVRDIFNDADMDYEEFEKLSLKVKTEWCRNSTHDGSGAVCVDASGADLKKIFTDLEKVSRTAPQDAYVYYENEAYVVCPEIEGNALNYNVLRPYIIEKLSELVVDTDHAVTPVIEITDCDCYLHPEVTSDNDFQLSKRLRYDLLKVYIDVAFHDDSIKLSGLDLGKYVSLNDDGRLNIDSDGIFALTESWAETYKEENVPYRFNSFVDGEVFIDFIKCSYYLDSEKLATDIIDRIVSFSSEPIAASYKCLDKKGEPFDISGTHVEVDIKNQHLAFYKNGELVIDTDVVTGRPHGRETPTGLYYAYDKQLDRWLIGDDYCVFVNYWVRIWNAYGLHDANWRNAFGGEIYIHEGSHGCVNIPNAAMKVIYEAIEDGDPVLVY